jgi:predicted RND superfamily exporter protein
MLKLPLALIGGVIGVVASGGVLPVASIIGFITLFGIATRNGVMLIAHIHQLVDREGVTDPMEAVKRAATERLVPILMTALAAGLALIPLALAVGQPGSEIQAAMAMVILYGLLTSTALNMIVVPALYLRFGQIDPGAWAARDPFGGESERIGDIRGQVRPVSAGRPPRRAAPARSGRCGSGPRGRRSTGRYRPGRPAA